MRFYRRFFTVSAAIFIVALVAGGFTTTVGATPPIIVTSQVPVDGPIKYTVKVASKSLGTLRETRMIRSGQTDDFTWKTAPPGPAATPAFSKQCPNNGAPPQREMRIRLAPVVAIDGVATVQMSIQARSPQGVQTLTVDGKHVQCPRFVVLNQVLRFTMPTDGSVKTLTLKEGSQVTIVARR